MKKKLSYIHPFLFALYPVIFLYSFNVHEYPEDTLLVPCVLVFLFAAVVFFVAKLILKRLDIAAIVSSVFIILCLSYGRILESMGKFDLVIGNIEIENKYLVMGGSLILFCLISSFVIRYKKSLETANKVLTALSLALILFSVYTIIAFEIKTGRLLIQKEKTQIAKIKQVKNKENLPDIYYFIFDRYAGPGSEKSQYNFDNSKFFAFLKDKGFYLAEGATTNYPKTFLSLGSSLNMEYLDFLTVKTHGGASEDESIVTPLIRNSKVLKFLKSKGYYTVNIGPKTWGPTSKNSYADKSFIISKGAYPYVDTFTTGFLNTTIAAPLLSQIFHDPIDVSEDPNNNEHRKVVLYEISAVEEAIAIPGPKFVFAHILIPHDPFVFDKDCNPIPEAVVEKHDHVYNYLNQLTCANKKISKLMTDILAKSKKPPIIILQSDEGPFPMKSQLPPKQGWGTAGDASLREKFPILNAYYFPGIKDTLLYPSITPVNSFRVLFNDYFGQNLPLLPDINYVFQDQENYYKFTDVTNRLKTADQN